MQRYQQIPRSSMTPEERKKSLQEVERRLATRRLIHAVMDQLPLHVKIPYKQNLYKRLQKTPNWKIQKIRINLDRIIKGPQAMRAFQNTRLLDKLLWSHPLPTEYRARQGSPVPPQPITNKWSKTEVTTHFHHRIYLEKRERILKTKEIGPNPLARLPAKTRQVLTATSDIEEIEPQLNNLQLHEISPADIELMLGTGLKPINLLPKVVLRRIKAELKQQPKLEDVPQEKDPFPKE